MGYKFLFKTAVGRAFSSANVSFCGLVSLFFNSKGFSNPDENKAIDEKSFVSGFLPRRSATAARAHSECSEPTKMSAREARSISAREKSTVEFAS
jgi:hypothetical protein